MVSPKKTAIVYCRTSTAAQKEADTIAAQVAQCKALAEGHGVNFLRYGPKRDGWIVDDGVTGSLLAGRAFAGLVDDLEARRVRPDFLIVYSLSRISRLDKSSRKMAKLVSSAADHARIKAVLLGAGVKVIDAGGIKDPSTVAFDIELALAAEEYKLIRGRTMSGKAERMARGQYAKGGRPPYGYRAVRVGDDRKAGLRLEVEPTEAANLRRVLAWYVQGGTAFAAHAATEERIPTPMAGTRNRKNKAADWTPWRWAEPTVHRLARDVRVYLGEQTLHFDGKPYSFRYPAIIDSAIYSAVERRRRERTLKRRANKLTTGFVDCACGAHVHARAGERRHYTICPAGCGRIREEEFSRRLWAATVDRLRAIALHERDLADGPDAYAPRLEVLKASLATVQADMTRLARLALSSGLDEQTYRDLNGELADKKAATQADLDRLVRERRERVERRATEETVEAKAAARVRELTTGDEPTLERKREVLADILIGGRVTVTWGPKRGEGRDRDLAEWAALTLPAFRDLPAVTVRTDDREVRVEVDGVDVVLPGDAERIKRRMRARRAPGVAQGRPAGRRK